MKNVELERIKFLVGLSHDVDFDNNIVNFKCDNDIYTLEIKKNDLEDVKYTISKKDGNVKVLKEKGDEVSCYNLKFRKIFDRYFGELTLDSTKQIMYEFSGDVLTQDVDDIVIISANSYDVSKKRGR